MEIFYRTVLTRSTLLHLVQVFLALKGDGGDDEFSFFSSTTSNFISVKDLICILSI